MAESNDAKNAFHSRIHAEGKFKEYSQLRDAYESKLSKAKLPKALAWKLAALHFPAPPGQPHEVEMTPQLAELLDKSVADIDIWADLISRVDAAKRCSRPESTDWIYEHAGTHPSQIDPAEVPSRGTLRHLQHVKEHPENYGEFLKTFAIKTMPDKKQIEREARFSDDGREQLELLEEFEASLPMKESAA